MNQLSLECINIQLVQKRGESRLNEVQYKIRRSRRGLTTKIHGVVDGLCNPLCLLLSAGNETDIKNVPPLLCTLSINGDIVNADRGYNSQEFVDWLKLLGVIPNISGRKSNKVQRECDWWEYKQCHLVKSF